MFYSTELLSIKSHSGLSVIWLAATLGPRSQTKKLSRKDYIGVDIVKSCQYVTSPPEPISLRLASNLMIGITRVYGQQCQIHYMDAQSFWSRLSLSSVINPDQMGANSRALTHASTKAPKEAITHAIADDISLSGEMLLSDILQDLLASPEGVRRGSKGPQMTTATTLNNNSRVPSLDSSMVLPFEPLGGLSTGLDDFFMGDEGVAGSWEEDQEDRLAQGNGSRRSTEEMKHGLFPGLGDGDLAVPHPDTISPAAKRARLRLRIVKTAKYLDQETILGRYEQFLDTGEGLLPPLSHMMAALVPYVPVGERGSLSTGKGKGKRPSSVAPLEIARHPLDSGPVMMDWDPYDYPPANVMDDGVAGVPGVTKGGVSASSSLAGGLSPLSRLSTSTKSIMGVPTPGLGLGPGVSSPVPVNEWSVSPGTAGARIHRESYGLLTEIQLNQDGPGQVINMKKLVKAQASKHDVAICFYKVLDLATVGALRVRQDRPFEDIFLIKSLD